MPINYINVDTPYFKTNWLVTSHSWELGVSTLVPEHVPAPEIQEPEPHLLTLQSMLAGINP